MDETYDFGGYATRNDVKCEDGRTIKKNAFKDCDGTIVPLVWNHGHDSAANVLGHALLKNKEDGVYAYCYFNDTENGQTAKQIVKHGDVKSLSIYANKLKQNNKDVVHGKIREVSLVLAGANPKAVIDDVMMHSADGEEAAFITMGSEADIALSSDSTLSHSDRDDGVDENGEGADNIEDKEDQTEEKTIAEIYESMSDEQKECVAALVGMALEDEGEEPEEDEEDDEDSEGEDNMKHNVFDKDEEYDDVLSHSVQGEILTMAKNRTGSLRAAMNAFEESGELRHDAISSGFVESGNGNIYNLFPEYQEVRPGAPELITYERGWVDTVLAKVHKSPISRVRTSQVDIRDIDALRARGYKKGKQKQLTGNFALIRRTTDPQTVYVRSSLHRDDIVDITDFDYVKYLYDIDKAALDEELARAILIGDGRDDAAEDKISPEHIRPIWTDDELYTIHADVDIDAAKKELQGTNTSANFGENYIYAEAIISATLHAREKYKGTGTPDFYCTPHLVNVMLLARDLNGRRIYNSVSELATALNVGSIKTVEQFEGKVRKDKEGSNKKLLALIVNVDDYALGATKGGEVTHFTQFDIDFNQQKSLLETRCSGALTRVYSAIALEEPTTAEA
jgi:HK97 family phage prohead protease